MKGENVRRANDYYPTPPRAVDAILAELDLADVYSFREPCRGSGAIYDKIDVPVVEWCELSEGRDYLGTVHPPVDLIITNPPFTLALPFLQQSLAEAACVVYLLRLGFLASQKRRPFWQRNNPTHLFAISERPSFTGDGKTDGQDYGWFCWDTQEFMKRPPGIYSI